MVKVEKISTESKSQVDRFIRIPFRIYKNHPQWVPPPMSDVKTQMNRQKHPFYEHSAADFFIASRENVDVGRIAALENIPFNQYHQTKKASFYFFECEDDPEVAKALFEAVFDWARSRGLDTIVGPKGFSLFDGYGIQVEGFQHRQMMTMMNYNFPYYPCLVEDLGFEKEVDFVSCYLDPTVVKVPEKVHAMAERIVKRGTFAVKRFSSKKELIDWGGKIGKAYNQTFINNWEYYPLSDRELQFLVDSVLMFADHRLIKIVTHGDDVAGFLFGFPDVSAALQRARGKLAPWNLVDILWDAKHTKWISLNGAGVLPEYQGLGGNILMYSEIEKTINEFGFKHADLTQVAETAVNMRQDLINLGGKPYKNHRVYRKKI